MIGYAVGCRDLCIHIHWQSVLTSLNLQRKTEEIYARRLRLIDCENWRNLAEKIQGARALGPFPYDQLDM